VTHSTVGFLLGWTDCTRLSEESGLRQCLPPTGTPGFWSWTTPGIRELVARVLRDEGFEVVLVNDGQAGLRAVQEAETQYDLVITDSYMPHLSSDQLIQQLHQQFPTRPVLHLDDGTYPKSTPSAIVPTCTSPSPKRTL
jgi:AmiR/NasT family two-component response regulator